MSEPMANDRLDEDFTMTAGELWEAVSMIGGELNGCPFEPIESGDPDHHGKEFVAEIVRVVIAERESMAALIASIRAGAGTKP